MGEYVGGYQDWLRQRSRLCGLIQRLDRLQRADYGLQLLGIDTTVGPNLGQAEFLRISRQQPGKRQ